MGWYIHNEKRLNINDRACVNLCFNNKDTA